MVMKMRILIENDTNTFLWDGKANIPYNAKKIIIQDGVESINSFDFNFLNAEEIVIPNSVKLIDDQAFEGCKKLKSIIIPESVEYIGDEAFDGCLNLVDVKILGNPEFGEDIFLDTPLEKEFYIDNSIKDNAEKSFTFPTEKLITIHNINRHKKDILDFIEKYFRENINKNPNRGHILPNGTFLSNNESDYGSLAHREIEEKLAEALNKELGYYFVDFDYDGTLGESIFDLLGCIRVNADNENYIALPKQKITTQQIYALEDWIGYFYWTKKKRWLRIATVDGQQHTYDRNEYDVDEVMQKINRYYNTGTLYESKQKVGEEKVKTVKYMPFELPKDVKSILKNSGNEKLLSNVYENDYKIKISNVGKNYRGLVESLNRVYTEKCVNYNSYTDTITIFKNYKETTGVSSIGQHKRSSIDLIPEDDSEINKFNVYDDAEDYEYLLELEPDFDTDYVENEDDSDYLYEEDTEDSEETENSETDELIINDISTNNTNTVKPNINNNDTTIYKDSDDDLEVNIDSQDSTNPMDDFQNRRSNNTSISI